MRPLLLNMQYFGPFMNETIDFRNLSKSQLFLICGKTGSGKTMIFDAIVYALYGKTSTEARDEVDLRSHFADPKLPTKVQFEFEIKHNEYQINRTVKYIKEGNKNATNPTVEVYKKVNGEWSLQTSTINTSNEYLKELLHMNVKQFRQILILPQGEFKQFLVSNSTDKRSILRTLFDSDRYETLQERLEEEMKKEMALIEGHYQKITQYMTDLHDFGNNELIDLKELEGHRYQKIIPALDLYKEVGNNKLNDVQKEKTEHEKTVQHKEKQFETEKLLKENFDTLADRRETLAALKKEENEMNELRTHLNYLKSVQSMTYQYNQLKEQQYELTKANESEINLQNKLKSNKVQLDKLEEQLKEITEDQEQIDINRKYIQKTNHIKANIQQYAHAEKELPLLKDKQIKLNVTIEQDKKEMNRLSDQLEQVDSDESIEHEKLNQQESLKLKLQNLEHTQKQFKEKEELEKKRTEISHNLKKLEQEKSNLEKEVIVDNKYDMLNVEAEILKIQKHVHQGEDCPICGSRIDAINGDLDFESLKKDKEHNQAIEKKIQNIYIEITTLNERMNITNDQFEKLQNIRDVQSEVEEVNNQIENLKKEIQKHRDNRQHIQQLQKSIREIEQRTTKNELEQNNIEHKINIYIKDLSYFKQETEHEYIQQFEKQYDQYNLDIELFDKKLNEVNTQIVTYKENEQSLQIKLTSIKERKEMYEKQTNDTTSYLNNEMTKHNITSYSQLDELLKQVSNIKEYEDKINQYDKKYIEIEAVVNELSEKVKNKDMPNISETETQLAESKDILNETMKRHNQLQLKIDQNNHKINEIQNVVSKIENDLQEQAEMIELSKIMNGKNSEKMSLENYVLIYYLNHILDNANHHFLKMTNSRYQLVRKKEKSQGLSGLEIEVFDRFSNRTRHITSLSGGETFQASLSLAIGLSNVVQEEAGAIHLESMFIDEGFGTLDSETLETALDTLVNIQMSGRLVGIISHVSELKTRIPTILNVNKNGFLSTSAFSNN
nr:exonuclease subunit SbcC [Mammaliicoccus sp. Marseille-Q6498]